ncbi:MAG: 3-hydroxybutyrate dehydrogenase, partial [Caldilineaceae bacterium]|nr:3-hydroxybutyrate dehydrogenase [Caldilineaceae bacterium]
MKQRIALVTGAASGIGKAVATALAGNGARIVITDINETAGAQVAAELNGLFVAADLSLRADCRRLMDKVLEHFGQLDILVNNAGFQHIDPIADFPEDVWDKMMAVMLTAPFLLTKYAWPAMERGAWGRIVNIGSVHSVRASPFKVGYITAKHGLLGLTRTAAREGGEHGITVNAVLPAYVRTPLVENQIADQARTRGLSAEDVVEQVMLAPAAVKRLVEPHEVGDLVAFLCSDKAGAITGADWTIDLGWTAG